MSVLLLKGLLMVSLVGLVYIPLARSCSCRSRPTHLQDLFCSVDYVLEITATGNEIVPDLTSPLGNFRERRYAINTTRVYKSSPEYEALTSKQYLYTADNSAACGIYMREEGTKYVILGNVRNNRIEQHLCGFPLLRVDWLTNDQICNLEYGYRQNCEKCEIKYCSAFEPCDQQVMDSQTCLFDQGLQEMNCYNKYALCKSRRSGFQTQCEWYDGNSGRLDICLNEIL